MPLSLLIVAGLLRAPVGAWTCADGVPGPAVYRDVCGPPAGVVYLIGHAGLGFAPLYRAWRAGGLETGHRAWYDGRAYRLVSVRVIPRDSAGAAVAWARGGPPLRLQFCATADSSRVVLAEFSPLPPVNHSTPTRNARPGASVGAVSAAVLPRLRAVPV